MNILTNLTPLLTSIAIIIILIGTGKSIWQGKIAGAILQLLLGCTLVFMIKAPNNFNEIGSYIIGFIKSLGGSING